MINRLLLLLHIIGALSLLLVNAKTYETDDAIIVEVDGKCEFDSIVICAQDFLFFFVLWISVLFRNKRANGAIPV